MSSAESPVFSVRDCCLRAELRGKNRSGEDSDWSSFCWLNTSTFSSSGTALLTLLKYSPPSPTHSHKRSQLRKSDVWRTFSPYGLLCTHPLWQPLAVQMQLCGFHLLHACVSGDKTWRNSQKSTGCKRSEVSLSLCALVCLSLHVGADVSVLKAFSLCNRRWCNVTCGTHRLKNRPLWPPKGYCCTFLGKCVCLVVYRIRRELGTSWV